ncbi:MAG: carbamoyl-phosphate synthase [Bdellovibrionales bacterium RIFOXYD1_FULL_53_11]|nr:MAG: carbamoyl-phosphate synthase [Bdellovibrionales bacterium RIFOXYD1_FULL_53_11]
MLKSSLALELHGADSNPGCIGRYFVDKFWHMPPIDTLQIDDLVDYCRKNNIFSIIPTRDGELPFFANNIQNLRKHGVSVMVSGSAAVQCTIDKLQFYSSLSTQGFPVIPTCLDIDDISSGPYVVKDRFGAGSKTIGLALDRNAALNHARHLQNPVFQPYIEGQELSIDLYVDRSGKTKGAVSRIRLLVVSGESQITATCRNDGLELLCSQIAEYIGIYGHAVFQAIIGRDGHVHIIECNLRMGGASNLGIKVGVDSVYWFLLESSGIDLSQYPFIRSPQEAKQIRYPEDMVVYDPCF